MDGDIIIFGKINKKFLLPFILALVQIAYNIFNEYYPEKKSSDFFQVYSMALGLISLKLFPFILKISNEQTTDEKRIKKKKWLHYFLLCLFEFVYIIIYTLGEYIVSLIIEKDKSFEIIIVPTNDFITVSFETIFLVVLSILLLKYKYYKHHIISIIIFLIFGIISDIILNNYENIVGNFFLFYFIKIIQAAINILGYCYEKYMMERLYYPYWNVSFYSGTFLFFMECINLIIVLADSKKKNSSFYLVANIYSYFNGENIGLRIGKIIIIFIFYIIMEPLIILIIFYFRPDFILIVLQFSYITKHLIQISIDKLYCIIFFIIQFFALMIHLEILELNFCDLNENTRRNIYIRSKIDFSEEDMDSSAGFNYIYINRDYSISISEKNENFIEMREQKQVHETID